MHYLIFLLNRNFFFKLKQINLIFYIYFIDALIITILIKNDLDQIIKIFRNLRLNIV